MVASQRTLPMETLRFSPQPAFERGFPLRDRAKHLDVLLNSSAHASLRIKGVDVL